MASSDYRQEASQEYPVNAGVLHSSVLSPTLFLLHINDLPDVIYNIAVHADDTTVMRHLYITATTRVGC